jgi:sialate O-acetylesterase
VSAARRFLPWAFLCLPAARAEVELAPLFGAGMVVQRERPIAVWGRAQPGERVSVSLAHRSAATVADELGRWEVRLDPLPAGGPHALRVSGHDELLLPNVAVGEVWVCAGQSNMHAPLRTIDGGPEAAEELEACDLRLFRATPAWSDTPALELAGSWETCAPAAALEFSSVGWFFGRRLERELGVPIGLIQCTKPAPAESWTDLARMQATPELAASLERRFPAEQARPGRLFNGQVLPLARFPVRGIAWYQGESNLWSSSHYGLLFRTLIESWRAAWDDPQLFFLFVQLPSNGEGEPRPFARWARLREGQASALVLPHTAMVVTIDIGEGEGFHPRDKRSYGERLAGVALSDVYGVEIASKGPVVSQVHFEEGRARLRFERVGAGLTTTDGQQPRAFALAGADRQWLPAEARITGVDEVVVETPAVSAPLAIRYAWSDAPRVNLTGANGLPAEPYRSDDWPFVRPEGERER